MKYLFKRLFAAVVLIAACNAAFAQVSVDVTKVKADIDKKIFSDGKTSVADYVISVLKTQTTCCSADNIYLEVKINAQGFATSVRAMNGANECMKRSAEDILKYVRWETEGKSVDKAIYFPLNVNIPCKGKPTDNQYAAVAKPAGWNFGENAFANSGTAEVGQTGGSSYNVLSEPPSANVTANDTSVAKLVGKPRLDDPKVKMYGKEKHPDPSHNKSHLNIAGPRQSMPSYSGTDSEFMIYIKSNLRKQQICGLAHCLAELAIDGAGEVKGIRVLQVNNDNVHQAVLPLFAKMKFNPTGDRFEQYFLMEFKTDIDCPNRKEINLEQVGAYFVAPDRGPKY